MGRKRVLRARVWYERICARSVWSPLTRESLAKFVAAVTRKILRGRLDDCRFVAFFSKEYAPRVLCAYVERDVGVTYFVPKMKFYIQF